MSAVIKDFYIVPHHLISHAHTYEFKMPFLSVLVSVGMMTSSNGNVFRVTCPVCGEFTSHRWIPLTKASDAKLWCFFDLRLNKQLCKQSKRWWFKTPSLLLRRHYNGYHRPPNWCMGPSWPRQEGIGVPLLTPWSIPPGASLTVRHQLTHIQSVTWTSNYAHVKLLVVIPRPWITSTAV